MYDQLLATSKSFETACKNHCTHTLAPRHASVPRSRNFSDCWVWATGGWTTEQLMPRPLLVGASWTKLLHVQLFHANNHDNKWPQNKSEALAYCQGLGKPYSWPGCKNLLCQKMTSSIWSTLNRGQLFSTSGPSSVACGEPLNIINTKNYWKYYPGQKKEPSSRFAARRTLFHVWYHARSGAISAGQVQSATVRDFCPALITPDRAWYHTWNSVLLGANLEDGSFFFLSRVVEKEIVREVALGG